MTLPDELDNDGSPMSSTITGTTVAQRRASAVGTADDQDARTAARHAVERALLGLAEVGAPPRLVVVFASSGFDPAELALGFGDAAGDVALVGCTTSGEITPDGPREDSVAALALGGVGLRAATSIATAPADGLRTAAFEAAGCVELVEPLEHQVLLLLADGLAGDQQEVVRGAYERVGAAIPLVGGSAGDDLAMQSTHQFHGGDVHSGVVVGAAITSEAPIGIGARHGWRAVGDPITVTQAAGTTVRSLDERPALEVYLERTGGADDLGRDASAFTRFAATRPIGLSRRGRDEIRFVATADPDEATLTCFAEVPQGGVCSVMDGNVDSVLSSTDDACAEALAGLGGAPPVGLVVFDCIARKSVLGPRTAEEVSRIIGSTGGAPLAGFYTYGEIARTTGPSGFHNQTLVVLAFA